MRFSPNVDKSSPLSPEVEAGEPWQPQLFEPGRRDHKRALKKLIRRGAIVTNQTAMLRQLCELMECRDPKIKDNEVEQSRRAAAHLHGIPITEYGAWVYYPWSNRLVQLLPKAEFREVRNSRNRYKISKEEEGLLAGRQVGIVGLSVGHAIAQVLAMEGCAAEYRLADPDTVSLSNLNRLPCAVGDLGVNKAILAARRMCEFDPYLTIVTFSRGINEETVDRFILEGGKLDLLIEECDDLYMKVLVRERARALRVPVIMETNDRGMLDIERFDLEPERPIFHGMLGNTHAVDLMGLTNRQKVPFILKILGEHRMSQRLAASLVEIDNTIVSWPQLGSGAMLGGGVAGDAARRILIGDLSVSGRFYVDVQELVSDRPLETKPPDDTDSAADVLLEPNSIGIFTNKSPSFSKQSGPSEELARRVVAAGILAPSGGNAQPWRFTWTRASRLRCILDISRSESFLDFERRAAYLSMGAVVENIHLAALDAGFFAEILPFPQSDRSVVCEIAFAPTQALMSSDDRQLARAIENRTTNRRLGTRADINQDDYQALVNIAASHDAELHLLTTNEELLEVAAILGEGDRFRFFCEPLFREMMAEMRWSTREAERTRDGIDIATLDLREVDQAGLRLLSSWNVVRFLKRLGIGGAIEDISRQAVESASAVALLARTGVNAESFFAGGRAMESVWLAATVRGLAIQPMSTLPYIFGRLQRGSGFDADEIRTLTALRARHEKLFRLDKNVAELLLFRIAKAGPPTVRSLRRPVEEVLSFE